MKNEQKYKTPNERVEAFDRWRKTINCEGCSQMCDKCEAGPLADECGFKWLALEAVGEEKVTNCNHLGNAAKMREALVKADAAFRRISKSAWFIDANFSETKEVMDAGDAVASALSATPRNCDRFATLDDARNAFFADYVTDETCSSATAFAIWIFDEAKGGVK